MTPNDRVLGVLHVACVCAMAGLPRTGAFKPIVMMHGIGSDSHEVSRRPMTNE